MMPPPLDGFDDGCIAEMENLYFMSYYFPKRLLTEYGNHETDQNKLTRDWILKLKRLNNININEFNATHACRLFGLILKSFIQQFVLKKYVPGYTLKSFATFDGGFSSSNKVGLMAVPGSSPSSKNAISMLIDNICAEDSGFVNLSDGIIRTSYVDSKKSTPEQKFNSLELNLNIFESFFIRSEKHVMDRHARNIIVVDDVYTTGDTLISFMNKLIAEGKFFDPSTETSISSGEQRFVRGNPHKSWDVTALDFFAFGKTLREEEIIENNFSEPKYEIKLPNLVDARLMNKDIKILQDSINNSIENFASTRLFNFDPTRVSKNQVVYHPTFGEGYVYDWENSIQGHRVGVEFSGYGYKLLLVSFAKLKTRKHGSESIDDCVFPF